MLLRVEDLSVGFDTPHGRLRAVAGVSFDVARGETLGLVGESGCGKSTTARAITMLRKPTNGTITFGGRDLAAMDHRALRAVRGDLQMIFQDPIRR